ncbi:sodium-independent anion transporter [Streptomyces sp. RB6PN25]|uniref:Sodium-independent anion transporter n=1 Tax=Streptomyces humicola TaxID=2953240 RepID=A0ABT1Q604_9ACTN|nr:sodium-independent anion transporter [Streptomyces humicola]MCQ4084805.1 sodium-independent anion transporter [Streptomyces humicola]
MWYANAVHFRTQLDAALARTIGTPHVVVLDAIGMSDIDFTGARSLRQVLDELDRRHIMVAIARVGERVRRSLARAGLLARIGETRFFASVNEAVTAMRPEET